MNDQDSGSARPLRSAVGARRPFVALGFVLLAVLPAFAGEPPTWPLAHYNPEPIPDDLLLPLPCGGAMAFRVIAVGPEPRALAQGTDLSGLSGPLRLDGNGQGAYLLGKYELTRLQAAALRAYARGSDCPSVLEPEQVGQDQALRAAAADQRRPEADIAWVEARALAEDYDAWLRLQGEGYPDCAVGRSPAQPCIPRLSGGAPGVVRLPTEAEWEYAARGGQAVSADAFGNALPPPIARAFGRYAWTAANANAETWRIGMREAGPLGLHDLFGNVSEIQYTSELDATGERYFIARGGGYQSRPEQATSGYRDRFRVHDERGRVRLSETGLRLLVGAPAPDAAAPGVPGAPDAALAALQVQSSVEPEPARQEAELTNPEWRQINAQLSALGHSPGEPTLWQRLTGGVPEATREALRAFQRREGLQAHGYATDRTRAALSAALERRTADAEAEAARQAAARRAEARAEAERQAAARRQAEQAAAEAEAEAQRQAEAEAEARRQAEAEEQRRAEAARAAREPFTEDSLDTAVMGENIAPHKNSEGGLPPIPPDLIESFGFRSVPPSEKPWEERVDEALRQAEAEEQRRAKAARAAREPFTEDSLDTAVMGENIVPHKNSEGGPPPIPPDLIESFGLRRVPPGEWGERADR